MKIFYLWDYNVVIREKTEIGPKFEGGYHHVGHS